MSFKEEDAAEVRDSTNEMADDNGTNIWDAQQRPVWIFLKFIFEVLISSSKSS